MGRWDWTLSPWTLEIKYLKPKMEPKVIHLYSTVESMSEKMIKDTILSVCQLSQGDRPSDAATDELGIAGTWGGPRGTDDALATLTITGSRSNSFNGNIRQKGYIVAITGQLDLKTLKVTMRETEVLTRGEGEWILATYIGAISSDKKEMSGTMIEGANRATSYAWSFSRQ